jgi:hypothetical protein
MPRRAWGISEQKIIAARQDWKCGGCGIPLPPAYECDHKKALWAGGLDCHEKNGEALCASCHAAKTQRESIARREMLRARRALAIEEAREEARARGECDDTAEVAKESKRKRPKPVDIMNPSYVDPLLDGDNPFLRFAYTAPVRRRCVT